MDEGKNTNKTAEQYNDIPVYYCKYCLSLKILKLGDDEETCYCDDCGSTEITHSPIEDWKFFYKKRYGKYFLKEDNKDGREEFRLKKYKGWF